ncbi:hypothetical protein [Streptomyces sp. NPDC058424]|uniref:hypothetical protein n=1 Tax=Streptomyces sp. NPDC058424 TaxID=3346491 RepID=UPI00365AFFEF
MGDRYYARPAHRDAAVTLMSAKNLPPDIKLQADLGLTRRNVLLCGVDIDAYVVSMVSKCGSTAASHLPA